MKVSEQIKELAKHNNVTITELANRLDTTQGNLANKLIRDNFKLSDIKDMANALGYTDIEIVLRGKGEDAVILDDSVEYKAHNIYMMTGDNHSLIHDIENNGFRDTTFKMLLTEVIYEIYEPQFRSMFNNTLDAYVPNDFRDSFREVFKTVLNKKLSNIKED